MQAVYTALKETESRATDVVPLWKLPFLAPLIPRQRKALDSVALIRQTTERLIAKCKEMVDAEEQVPHPHGAPQPSSMLHFLFLIAPPPWCPPSPPNSAPHSLLPNPHGGPSPSSFRTPFPVSPQHALLYPLQIRWTSCPPCSANTSSNGLSTCWTAAITAQPCGMHPCPPPLPSRLSPYSHRLTGT